MAEIKRYTNFTGGIFPTKDGPWVRYEDHKKVVEELEKYIRDLERASCDGMSYRSNY